jgi:hypothetical protein
MAAAVAGRTKGRSTLYNTQTLAEAKAVWHCGAGTAAMCER